MKLVFLDAETVGELDLNPYFQTFGDFEAYPRTGPEQTLERLKGAQVAITNKVLIRRKEMEALPDLKLICVAATGTNNIDLEAAKEHKIDVMNVKGYSTPSVVQHTFALLFSLLHQSHYYDQFVKQGTYSQEGLFTHHGRPYWELHGKTFGIIGLGTIGQEVAKVAEAFGAKVVYHSSSGRNTDQPYPHLPLYELLEKSDVVSIHAPLNENTRDLIDKSALARMQPHAFLLNTGRGGIVVEADLVEALNHGRLAGAALDVMETEPIPSNSSLLQKLAKPERLLLSPHIAWASLEARKRLLEGIRQNLTHFVDQQ